MIVKDFLEDVYRANPFTEIHIYEKGSSEPLEVTTVCGVGLRYGDRKVACIRPKSIMTVFIEKEN